MGIHDRQYYREDDQGMWSSGGEVTLTTKLVIVNVVVLLVDAFSNQWLSSHMSLASDLFHKPWNFWQLVTHGFLHSPLGSDPRWFFHIGMNMFVLWMFGRPIEAKYGRAEFLKFYLTAIVVAGLVWVGAHNLLYAEQLKQLAALGRPAYALGASGGVTAVLMLFIFNYPKRTLYVWGLIAVPAWLVGAILVGTDVLRALSDEPSRVAWEAHLGGAAFGALYYKLGFSFSRLWPSRLAAPLVAQLKPKPKLRVHQPDDAYRDLDTEADAILDKLHRQGQDSLNERERRILEDYSRRMRQKHR